jgi:hypothetical protein
MDYNFISKKTSPMDLILFFDPLEGDTFELIEDNWNMANIMAKAGVFPSISQARKNRWNIPIPKGFSEYTVGKKKIQITILNKVN